MTSVIEIILQEIDNINFKLSTNMTILQKNDWKIILEKKKKYLKYLESIEKNTNYDMYKGCMIHYWRPILKGRRYCDLHKINDILIII
jgi:hypothetical protein